MKFSLKSSIVFIGSVVFAVGIGMFSCKIESSNDTYNVSPETKNVAVTDVELDKTSLKLTEKEKVTLIATVLPENATNKGLIWISSNPEVVTVDNGEVSAISQGDAKIIVATNDGGKIATCSVTVVKDVKITLNFEGGTILKKDGVSVSESFELFGKNGDVIEEKIAEQLQSSIPVKTGYTFGSWNPNLPEKFPVKNETYNAVWTANTYKIVFDANGGTGVMDEQSFSYDEEAPLSKNTFTKSGYDFIGWATSANSEKIYDDEAEIKNLTAENNATFTFYAKWKVVVANYTVKHWQENADDDDFTLFETETLSDYTDSETLATAKTYEHFNVQEITQKTIAGDGSTVVDVYYKRDIVTLTFYGNGGYWNETESTRMVSGKWGAKVTYPESPKLTGYGYRWEPDFDETEFLTDKTYKANWFSFYGNLTAGNVSTVIPDYKTAKNIVIPDYVKSIGKKVFWYCYLECLSIPDSVTSIGESAFEGCKSLESVTIPDSVTSIGDGAFSFCTSLKSVTIPDSVTSIEAGAFESCKSLESVTIPNSVTSIGESAFSDCKSLMSVRIPDSVTSIGISAFNGCTSLKSVTIPNSVTSIIHWTFKDCTSLVSVTIPNSVTSIGEEAFGYCESLESVMIPNSVTSIGDRAFYRCTLLESVTIPDGVTSIGDGAFCFCTSLKSVTIPDSVTRLGKSAFNG